MADETRTKKKPPEGGFWDMNMIHQPALGGPATLARKAATGGRMRSVRPKLAPWSQIRKDDEFGIGQRFGGVLIHGGVWASPTE